MNSSSINLNRAFIFVEYLKNSVLKMIFFRVNSKKLKEHANISTNGLFLFNKNKIYSRFLTLKHS